MWNLDSYSNSNTLESHSSWIRALVTDKVLLTMYYVQLTMYYLLCALVTDKVLLTMYYVLLTMCYLLCTTDYVPLTMYHLLCALVTDTTDYVRLIMFYEY